MAVKNEVWWQFSSRTNFTQEIKDHPKKGKDLLPRDYERVLASLKLEQSICGRDHFFLEVSSDEDTRTLIDSWDCEVYTYYKKALYLVPKDDNIEGKARIYNNIDMTDHTGQEMKRKIAAVTIQKVTELAQEILAGKHSDD
jgi:hypothetical protein